MVSVPPNDEIDDVAALADTSSFCSSDTSFGYHSHISFNCRMQCTWVVQYLCSNRHHCRETCDCRADTSNTKSQILQKFIQQQSLYVGKKEKKQALFKSLLMWGEPTNTKQVKQRKDLWISWAFFACFVFGGLLLVR